MKYNPARSLPIGNPARNLMAKTVNVAAGGLLGAQRPAAHIAVHSYHQPKV